MKRKSQIKDLLKNRIISNLKVDEEKNLAIYFVNSPHVGENRLKKSIVILNTDTMKEEGLILPFEPEDYVFNEEGVVFVERKSGNSILWSYDLTEKRSYRLVEVPFSIKTFSIGSEYLYFTAEVQDENAGSNVKCSEYSPFYQEGRGIVGSNVTGLFRSSLDSTEISLISSLDMDVDRIDYDLDKCLIMFTSFKKARIKPVASDVYTYDICKESLDCHTEGNLRVGCLKIMTEKELLFMAVNLDRKSRNDNQQIYIIDLKNKQIKRLGEEVDYSNEYPGIATDCVFTNSRPVQKKGSWLYHIRVQRDREMLCRINLDGHMEYINTGIKEINGYCLMEEGILISGLKGLKLDELYLYSDQVLQQITTYNRWLDEVKLSRPEKLTFNHDDCEFDGWVYGPQEIEEGKTYPGILMTHGGPKMIYSDVYFHDVQVLTSCGYYVFYMNPKGSDGRGDRFSDIRGHFGSVAFNELMDFTDRVLYKYKKIDGESLGVMGGSYGGYMTNYIISHTDRFKAAVSERGISNLLASFTSSDIGYKFIYEYMGNRDLPWDNPQAYMEESPITYVNRVKTPTLFIHGKDDRRCHYTESMNMFNALNFLGLDTRICIFENENHGLHVRGRPLSKLKRYEELVGWFGKYLLKEN